MALYRSIVSIPLDSALPRDAVNLTPWFNDHGLTTDPQNLASSLADVFSGVGSWLGAAYEITVKMYEHTPGDPTTGPPKASVTKNKGSIATCNGPREIALCLSYYAGQNIPGRRGRLYLPITCLSGGTAQWTTLRPDAAMRSKVSAIGGKLAAIGGADVDWVVHSKRDDASFNVSNTWVDDEWDTQRRRGLGPTARTLAAPGA